METTTTDWAERQRQEQAQRAESRARTEETGRALALALGEGWTVEGPRADDYEPRVRFAGPDRENVTMEGGAERWCFSAYLPPDLTQHFFRRNGGNPAITCSASKPPETLARDIERRLLPQHRQQLAEARRNKDRADRDAEERNAIRDRLLEALAGHAEAVGPPCYATAGKLRLVYGVSPFWGGEVEVSCRDKEETGSREVSMKVRGLTPDEAEAICRVLAKRPLLKSED